MNSLLMFVLEEKRWWLNNMKRRAKRVQSAGISFLRLRTKLERILARTAGTIQSQSQNRRTTMKTPIKLQRFIGFHLDHDTFSQLRRGTLLGGVSVSGALRVLVKRWIESKYKPIITVKEMSKFPGAGRPLGKD